MYWHTFYKIFSFRSCFMCWRRKYFAVTYEYRQYELLSVVSWYLKQELYWNVLISTNAHRNATKCINGYNNTLITRKGQSFWGLSFFFCKILKKGLTNHKTRDIITLSVKFVFLFSYHSFLLKYLMLMTGVSFIRMLWSSIP